MNSFGRDAATLAETGDCFRSDCPARGIFNHVTGRWGGLVLAALLDGTLRFSALRARVGGISEKMLAQTLREFERDGLLVRRQFPEVPPRVEYELTAAGLEIAKRLFDLISWIQEHVRDLVALQQLHRPEPNAVLGIAGREVVLVAEAG